MALRDSFNKTNFDLENDKPDGGPINAPTYNYKHNDLPTDTYLDKDPIMGTDPGRKNHFRTTNLDMTDSDPNNGAPISVPGNFHKQNWTPSKKYIDDLPT